MKSILHNFKTNSGCQVRVVLFSMLFFMFGNFASAQSSGIFESYAILSIKGGSNSYYDMQATTGNPDFNGANLGNFVYGLETLVFKGGQNKTYKNGGCNINSSAINYRIYLSGSPTGSYTTVNEPFFSNLGGGGDQQWEGTSGATNLIAGLSPGTYTIEAYSQAGYDSCGSGTHYSSNGGSNYKAAFTVVKAESLISATGATIFPFNGTPQGPSTSVVTGSTGLVSYSYEGIGGTSYSASPTPPTNAGTYTVKATVASDANYNGATSAAYSFEIGAFTYIPDSNFEQALIDLGYDSGSIDHYVLTSAISGVTDLDVSSTNISDLTGIGAFSSLYQLICENNLLTSLDVSALSTLRNLSILGNKLVNASDLKAHPNLTYLDIDDNLLTSIDVSALPNLTDLYCSGNQLANLDVRGLPNLAYFECLSNPSLSCILVDDVAYANTQTTTIGPGNLPSQPYFYAKDGTAHYSYCDCTKTTTWTSAGGGSWSDGEPLDGTYAAIISGNYNKAANINACSLTIDSGANVFIPSGFNVTLNAPISVATGSTFTLSNNANLIQTNKKSINSGDITVNRDSNPLYRLDYTMWSSPVSGVQTLADFSPLTSQSPNRFYIYDNTLGTTGLFAEIAPTTPFAPGTGYLIRMPNEGSTNYNAGTETLTYNGVFNGLPNNGDVTIPVTSDTYNAIGNPYPSTISADAFITDNGIADALYFWRKKNNLDQATAPTTSYATYTFAGATGTEPSTLGGIIPNGTIQVGQGFIAKSTSTSLNFTNSMRVANNANQILKTKKVVERNRIWLNLTNPAGAFNQMMVAYMTGATIGIDDAIDGRYFNDSETALNSLLNNEEYVIQGRNLPFDATDVVPLAFKTTTGGNFTIAIDRVDGLFSGSQDIFLVDASNATETNLKTSSYTFTAASGVDNARFSLKYQKTLKVDVPTFDDSSVTIYKNKGTLNVNSKSMAIANIKVYDIQGRMIYEQKNVQSNTATIRTLKVAPQILIVKVTGEDNKVVSKKIVY